jgi:hypothetical protein
MSERTSAPAVHVAAALRQAMPAASMPHRGSLSFPDVYGRKCAPLVDGTVMSSDLELPSSQCRHHSGDPTDDVRCSAAGAALDERSDGGDSDDDLPPLADFLDVNVMTLSSTTSQWRHRNAGEHAPLLPGSDTVVRVARAPHAAHERRVWHQEHRAASAGRGAGKGRSQGQIEARLGATRRVIPCGKCGGLVDYMRAMAAPRRRGGMLTDTAGCSARGCSKRHRPAERRAAQRLMAMDVLSGLRVITARPCWPHERCATVISRTSALALALATVAATATRATVASDAVVPTTASTQASASQDE